MEAGGWATEAAGWAICKVHGGLLWLAANKSRATAGAGTVPPPRHTGPRARALLAGPVDARGRTNCKHRALTGVSAHSGCSARAPCASRSSSSSSGSGSSGAKQSAHGCSTPSPVRMPPHPLCSSYRRRYVWRRRSPHISLHDCGQGRVQVARVETKRRGAGAHPCPTPAHGGQQQQQQHRGSKPRAAQTPTTMRMQVSCVIEPAGPHQHSCGMHTHSGRCSTRSHQSKRCSRECRAAASTVHSSMCLCFGGGWAREGGGWRGQCDVVRGACLDLAAPAAACAVARPFYRLPRSASRHHPAHAPALALAAVLMIIR